MFNHLHEYPLGVHIVSFGEFCLVFMVKIGQKFRRTDTVTPDGGIASPHGFKHNVRSSKFLGCASSACMRSFLSL